ncbi:hypothetical protein KAU33_03750 [Candidatus Dependentiae bacterium]|nr:hypothetical protein [Candidatus Dependentiae bacterium]
MKKSKISKKKETLSEFIQFRLFTALAVLAILCVALSILSFLFDLFVIEGIYGIWDSPVGDMPIVFLGLAILFAIIWLVWVVYDVGNAK